VRLSPLVVENIIQIDDHFGFLFGWLEEIGNDSDTMIAFTSDHCDYLGDH